MSDLHCHCANLLDPAEYPYASSGSSNHCKASSSMNPKRHHYVPETYLKGFANPDGFLLVGRKDEPERLLPQKPENVGFRKYYYSQYDDQGNRDNRMEALFGKMENCWPKLRSKMAGWNRLSPKDCEELWLFIGTQRVRVPAARDLVEALLAHRSKMDAFALIASGDIPPPPKELEGRLNELVVSIDPRKSIEAMPFLLRELQGIFSRIGLKIIHNVTDVHFLTSDNPVCIFDPRKIQSKLKPYVVTDDGPIQLIFPVDQRTMVCGHTDWRRDFAVRGPRHEKLRDKEAAKRLNSIIARFSYELLVGPTEDHLALLQAHADHSPVLLNALGWTAAEVSGAPTVGFGPRTKKPKWKG